MTTKLTRPPSVLIAQVILLALGLMWAVFGIMNLAVVAGAEGGPVQKALGAAFSLFVIIVSAACIVAFIGLAARKLYGRWLGVGALSLLAVSTLVSNFRSPGGFFDFKSGGEFVGWAVVTLAFYGLLVFLIYRLARGDRANAFFAAHR